MVPYGILWYHKVPYAWGCEENNKSGEKIATRYFFPDLLFFQTLESGVWKKISGPIPAVHPRYVVILWSPNPKILSQGMKSFQAQQNAKSQSQGMTSFQAWQNPKSQSQEMKSFQA